MKETTKARIELLLAFTLILYILPLKHSVTDFGYWLDWALAIHDHGITNVYRHGDDVNYHPIFLYMIWLYDVLMPTREHIIANINYLKIFPLIFDFLPVVVLCCFRQRLIQEKIPYLFLILNIAYLFNSVCWGQVDSIFTSLCFLALLTTLYRPSLGVVIYILAFYTKFHSIMFLPVMFLILAYKVRSWRGFLQVVIASVATVTIVLLPFIIQGRAADVFNATVKAVDFWPRVSVQAYNIWFLLVWGVPYDVFDSETFIILTYKQTGLIMFLISSGLTLIPLTRRLLSLRLNNAPPDRALKQLLMITLGLICFNFFYFNTQMHERYIHPALIMFFFYAVYSKNYIPYILISVAYLMSLEKTFPDFLPIERNRILFSARAIALLYTSTLVYTMVIFYRQHRLGYELKELRKLLFQWHAKP